MVFHGTAGTRSLGQPAEWGSIVSDVPLPMPALGEGRDSGWPGDRI